MFIIIIIFTFVFNCGLGFSDTVNKVYEIPSDIPISSITAEDNQEYILNLEGMSFTMTYVGRNFPDLRARETLLEEELETLFYYDTADKILTLTEEITRYSSIFDISAEGLIPKIFNSDFVCRPLNTLLNNKDATLEELIFVQALALRAAGDDVRLVTVPTVTEKGIRAMTFVAYKKPEEEKWQFMYNPLLAEFIQKDKLITSAREVRDLALNTNSRYPAYAIIPDFSYLVLRLWGKDVDGGYKFNQGENFKDNLIENFLTAARESGIQIGGEQNLRKFELEEIKALAFALQLLPKDILKAVNRIRFLEGSYSDFIYPGIPSISTGLAFYVDFLFFGMSQIDLFKSASGYILVHEIGHIFEDFVGGINFYKNGFRGDVEFLESFYNSKSRNLSETIIFHETFAEMFSRFVTTPELLRAYVIKEIEKGNLLPLYNYLLLKERVFLNTEYGDTCISSIWRTKEDGREYICYRKNSSDYCLVY
ncbi:MAG: hypothetical protein NC818_05670 [Candidatus Omnitrophica bacterium]|nr:hypothetical protein [Candidatus Omnitrophota bacterium]